MNILLSSVGRRTYLVKYFKEVIEGQVHVANSSDITPAFQEADASVLTPLIYDNTYIDFLIDYCRKNEIKAIISLFDIDLPILAKNKERFLAIGTQVIVSSSEVLDICNDKWHTYNFLLENEFNAPKTFISIIKAKMALKEGALKFPLIIKPRWGMGSIGIYVAENSDELEIFYKKVQREIQKTYLKYESAVDLDHAVLIQEKIDGKEFGLDVINDLTGKYRNTIIKQKYAMRSGETDCAITVERKDLQNLGERLSECLKQIGNLDVDVFVTDETTYVLEMNARFGGGYPFSHLAGVNLPKAIVEWLSGKDVSQDLLTAEIGVMGHKDIKITRIN